MIRRFRNRTEAGRALAAELERFVGEPQVLVLALPRGGVPVAYEIAVHLKVPMDVFLVRKLGVPGQEELAMGAIASGGVRIVNDDILRMLQMPESTLAAAAAQEQIELERREHLYRGKHALPDLKNRTIILVDDGLATGASMRAAVAAVRSKGPSKIVVAVPTGARDTSEELLDVADEVVCLTNPEPFYGVGGWYEDFAQISDEQVCALLKKARELHNSEL